ncbi:DNA primase [Bacillaceae bacterium W0354]
MQKIPEELIDQIKKSNDIVDVVSEHIKLTRRGRNYFGLCPFHGEDTPSFSVSPDKQIFHCFGCGKGGNVINFVMEIKTLTFIDAVKYLADKTGDHIPEQFMNVQQEHHSPEQRDLLKAYEWSTKLFHHVLKHTTDGKDALNYLKNRGFTDEAIEQFQIGYSPNKSEFLSTFLKGKGFKIENLVENGLLSTTDGNSFFDRMIGRVIFPIHNHQGKIVGFGGRSIDPNQEPKYLNSPDSKLFHKSRLLFNFYEARRHFQKSKEVIIFEGFADVIKAFQGGVQNSVATLGTSLTKYHANILKRYVDDVIICFDGDKAGKEASYRAAKIVTEAGLNVRIANLPNEMDPDEYIEKYGGEKFRENIIKAAESFVSFSLNFLKKDFNLSINHDRIKYVEKALDIIAKVEHAVERDLYLKELEETFGFNRSMLDEEIGKRHRIMNRVKDNDIHDRKKPFKQPWNKDQKMNLAYHNAERFLIAHMLQDPYVTERVQNRIGATFNIEEHQVLVTYLYAYYEEGNDPDVSRFIERLPDESIKRIVTNIALTPISGSLTDAELEDYIKAIVHEHEVNKEIRLLQQMLKQAESENDPKTAAKIGMKIIELKKKNNQK